MSFIIAVLYSGVNLPYYFFIFYYYRITVRSTNIQKTKNYDWFYYLTSIQTPSTLVNILYQISKLQYQISKIMFVRDKPEVGMNLPVGNHIERLGQMINDMKNDTESLQKELQILRGNITQLSYINKQSDFQLNSFLIDGIASLRNKWSEDWDKNQLELLQHKKKHEDVQITREQLQEKVVLLELAVGLRRVD